MKTLIIVRHAKSSWETSLPDFERPLNDRGERDAPNMAKRLKEKKVYPDLMITSPATRAAETCRVFAGILGFSENKVLHLKELYHASEDTIFNIVNRLKDMNDKEEVVLMFGHNPGLTEFVNQLTEERIDNVPTTGVVAIRLNVTSWTEVKPGAGRLLWFDYPKKRTG